MKKLLLLGGSRYLLPVIEAAHRLDCYVITCDYLPNNIAHKYSDEYVNVSIIEKDSVLKVAAERNIDGVMSFACDPGVITAAYVAEKMQLPSVADYETVSVLQNKMKFREFLRENQFNTPQAVGGDKDSICRVMEVIKDFHWPVIVKPVDSAGSKGVSKVENIEEIEKAIEFALKFSCCHEFIIEEFIEKAGDSTDADCFSVDGEMSCISFSNQKFDANIINPYTPAGFTWPPEMGMLERQELIAELKRLCKLLRLGTSIYNVEARVGIDGKPYIMEFSPRGGGNRLAEMLKYVSGIDLIENAVKAAIGEPCEKVQMPIYKGYWYEHILHAPYAGRFNKLWIHEEIIKNYLLEEDIWVSKGDAVNEFSGAHETIGTLVMRFPSKDKMEDVVTNWGKYINVIID